MISQIVQRGLAKTVSALPLIGIYIDTGRARHIYDVATEADIVLHRSLPEVPRKAHSEAQGCQYVHSDCIFNSGERLRGEKVIPMAGNGSVDEEIDRVKLSCHFQADVFYCLFQCQISANGIDRILILGQVLSLIQRIDEGLVLTGELEGVPIVDRDDSKVGAMPAYKGCAKKATGTRDYAHSLQMCQLSKALSGHRETASALLRCVHMMMELRVR